MGNQKPSGSFPFSSILAVVLLISAAQALEVAPNSPCSPLCLNNIQNNPGDGDVSYTIASDVPCEDWEIVGSNTTVRGRKWKDCLSCQTTSDAIDTVAKENDVYWLLFNMKFTLDWCVFGYPDNRDISPANEKCSEICAGPNNSAKRAMTDRLLQTNQTLQYLYCDGPDIENILDDCAACLDKVPNAKALGHYAEGMKEGCVQRPKVGETLKIDFDLFPTAATPTTSITSPARTETETETVTLTSALPYPPPLPAGISASSASAVAASSSAAAAAKSSHDKNVRVGVGVGVGVGSTFAIAAAAICLILARRRSTQRKRSEQDARARWESEYHAGMEQKLIRDRQRSELGQTTAATRLVEADDGRPTELPMLDNSTVTGRGSPGTFSSSGGIGAGAGGGSGGASGDRSWPSTPRGSRASRSGVARMLGMKPAVPAKN